MRSTAVGSELLITALCLIVLLLSGCATEPVVNYERVPPKPGQVSQRISKATKTLLMPFWMPDYARSIRGEVGKIFYLEMMSRPPLRRIAREETFAWFDEGETDGERFRAAADYAAGLGFDMVLLGEVERIIISRRTSMEVAMIIYAVDVRSKKILFVEDQVVTGRPARSLARYIFTADTSYIFPPSLEEMIRLASRDLALRCSLHFF